MTSPPIRTLIPELHPAQWKLLERALLEGLPKEIQLDGEKYTNTAFVGGYNQSVIDCTAAISKVLGGEG